MNLNQKKAVTDHFEDIIEALGVAIEPFLDRLHRLSLLNDGELNMVNRKTSNEAKLNLVFKLIAPKDKSWETIIKYLRCNQYGTIADNLTESEVKRVTSTDLDLKMSTREEIRVKFRQKLADYYLSEYSHVPTMSGYSNHVRDVWIPLIMEEKTNSPCQKGTITYLEMLQRLADSHTSNTALITGHPGVGKTTLAKKIAYDWAAQNIKQFTLVLTIPLRHVGSTDDFLQLASDYYLKELSLPLEARTELLNWLRQLDRDLLICLDGLDEYGSLGQSPLKELIAEKFGSSIKTVGARVTTFFPYHLLITSRPYACDVINRNFFPLRFQISSLDEAHINDFARNHCATSEGVQKVNEYLKLNAKWVIRVPLILTFVCYLADAKEDIPTNLTSFYERFLGQMVNREIEACKLRGDISFETWKESEVVKSTAELAFQGCKTGKFEFSVQEQMQFNVMSDSFTCGFLLSKFDFSHERLIAEFSHRSIQEFLAALCCYWLISSADSEKRDAVMKEILNGNSQFGRFFFGICSKEKTFDGMLQWLDPTFEDAKMILFDFSNLLLSLSASSLDCSEAEMKSLGQRLAVSLDQLENQIRAERDHKIILWSDDVSCLNKSFQAGLNLNFLPTRANNFSWYLTHVSEPNWSRLTYVDSNPRRLRLRFERMLLFQPSRFLNLEILENFDKIQIFVWGCSDYDLNKMFWVLDQLPPVSTMIIQTIGHVDFEVNFRINYNSTATIAAGSAVTQLRHFTFGMDEDILRLLRDLFSKQREIEEKVIVTDRRKTGDDKEISWLTIEVDRALNQSKLLRVMTRFAWKNAYR